MKKLERQEMASFHDFDEAAEVTGTVKEYREITTKYGVGNVITIQTDSGETKAIMESAGLKGYGWPDLIGKKIHFKSMGYKKTPNGLKRDFEVFEA